MKHLSITSALEAVPLTKDIMYPSLVSSQLCKYKSDDVEQFSAAELCAMTEEVVLDLKPVPMEEIPTSRKPPRKRKRVAEE